MQENVNIPDSTITTNLSFRQLVLMNMQQLTNFPYIEKDFDALTDYELLCLVVKFLNDVIANQNEQNDSITRMYESFLALQTYVNNTKDTLEDAFNTLDNYVRNYFDNLDVQDEIDHKLDEYVADGTLEHIIASYLQTQKIYNTALEMIADADNLVDGLNVQTLGYFSKNDGGGAFYQITDTESLTDYQVSVGTLYATLMKEDEMNLTQFGISETSEDITEELNDALSYCSSNKIKLIIPENTYMLKVPKTKTTDTYNYSYFIELLDDTNIVGKSKDLSILKVDSSASTYTSVFFNDSTKKNITLDNFTIEQYYESGDNMSLTDRGNIKCAIVMYGQVSNVKVKNMFFKNCCGVNTLAFNNASSENIIIENNYFDYHHVVDVNHYDRSIVYCECHDYLVTNNKVKGNFETLGGIECHGYNGRCENNIVEKCFTSIHIAPRFDETICSANIIVTNNILKDNATSIKLWENTHPSSTIDCKGITITNNDIKMSGYVFNQNFWLSVGDHRAESLTGITINEYTSNHDFSDIIIANNSLVVNDYSSYSQYVTVGSGYCSGISIAGANDVSNVQIVNNYIEGWAGAGISTGSFNTAIVKNTDNVIITNNTILNVGTGAENQIVYKSPISLKYGVINNMIIRNNNIIKTDSNYNAYVSIYNQTNASSTRTNLYCDNNVIYSVIAGQYAITNNSLKNIIIDRGATADRPINANKGDTYYDTEINKLIVYNGSAWINVDGSSLT